jgi:hypothetical protein
MPAMKNFIRIALVAGCAAVLTIPSTHCQEKKPESLLVCDEAKIGGVNLQGLVASGEAGLLRGLNHEGLADIVTLVSIDTELIQSTVWLSGVLPPLFRRINIRVEGVAQAPEFVYSEQAKHTNGSEPKIEPASYRTYRFFMKVLFGSRVALSRKRDDIGSFPGVKETIQALMRPDEWDADVLQENGELSDLVADLYAVVRDHSRETRDKNRLNRLLCSKLNEAYPGIGWYERRLSNQKKVLALVDLQFKSGVEVEILPFVPLVFIADDSGRVAGARIAENADGSQMWYYLVERDGRGIPTSVRILIGREFEGQINYEAFLLCVPNGGSLKGARK